MIKILASAAVAFTLVSASLVAPATAAEDTGRAALAVLPIKLLDTSQEPTDQSAEHARRLAAMAETLARDLKRTGAFEDTVLIDRQAIIQACPQETPACLLAAAKARGATFAFVGVVQKSSMLIMQMWAHIVAVDTGNVVVSRQLTFRGDNDEAWARAEAFLVRELVERKGD